MTSSLFPSNMIFEFSEDNFIQPNFPPLFDESETPWIKAAFENPFVAISCLINSNLFFKSLFFY